MNKLGVYRVLEQAIRQYFEETGVLITNVNTKGFVDVSTEDKRQCVIKLETTEEQIYGR